MLFVAHRHPLVWPRFHTPRTVAEVLDGVTSTPLQLEAATALPYERMLWRRSARTKFSLRYAYQSFIDERGEDWGVGKCTPSFMGVRLQPDRVCPVMTGHRMHHREPRYLTYPEMLAIHGLPATWKTSIPVGDGTRTLRNSMHHIQAELQRAVLPPVGRWIATAVIRGLKQPPLKTPVHRLVDFRKPDAPVTAPFDLEARYE
jgi:site-specific DNA-cytosine methylase